MKTNPVSMNQPYDNDLKTFNFNQSLDPNEIQSHYNGDSQQSSNQNRGLNLMIKDPSFCMIAGKKVSFWQAFCGFDAASMILERWFWWLQLLFCQRECDGKFALE